MTPVEVVAAVYDAFGRGDVEAILEHVSDTVAWDAWEDNSVHAAGVPWLVRRDDKAGVREFFGIVGQFTIHEFQVLDVMSGARQVAAEILIDATIPNGSHYRDEEIHLWTFDDNNRIVRFRHYVDTAKHIRAARGE